MSKEPQAESDPNTGTADHVPPPRYLHISSSDRDIEMPDAMPIPGPSEMQSAPQTLGKSVRYSMYKYNIY